MIIKNIKNEVFLISYDSFFNISSSFFYQKLEPAYSIFQKNSQKNEFSLFISLQVTQLNSFFFVWETSIENEKVIVYKFSSLLIVNCSGLVTLFGAICCIFRIIVYLNFSFEYTNSVKNYVFLFGCEMWTKNINKIIN